MFEKIKKDFEQYDKAREEVIKRSRDILKNSKQAIYSIHRGDIRTAEKKLEEAKKIKKELEENYITGDCSLRTGGFSNACEEYAEAASFIRFVEEGGLISIEELNIRPEEYLGGLADLTGELTRRAVIRATEQDIGSVRQIRDFIDSLYGAFVQFDFRNGDLRRKYDSIKYNLQKVERLLYELSHNA